MNEQEEKTNFEKALDEAKKRTGRARRVLVLEGKMNERVEKLIDEAQEAWNVVEEMLGNRRAVNENNQVV